MKFHLSSIIRVFISSLILFPSILFAQEADQLKDQALIEGYVRDFARSYAAIPTTKDTESVLKYLSKQSQSTIFYFSISENMRRQNSDYEGFAGYLRKLALTDGMEVKYELKEIIRNHVHEDVAVVVAVIDYELQKVDGFHAKGSETVSFAWKKTAGAWQIVQYTVMGIEDEKLRGTCLCEVFSASDGQYVVRTTVPSGRSYETSFNEFKTTKSNGDTFIKTSDQTVFRMGSDGVVWQQYNSADYIDRMAEPQSLGKARGEKGAILLVIQHHIYPNRCTQIKYNK